MNKHEIEEIVCHAVEKTLTSLGFDTGNPLENQADQLFVKKSRKRCESITGRALMTVVSAGVLAGFSALGWAILEFLKQT